MKLFIILNLVLTTFFCANLFAQKKTNVIVVVIDDVGPAWISPYTSAIKASDMDPNLVAYYSKQQKQNVDVQKHINTAKSAMPFLDSLSVASGTIFNRAFSTASICAPSRGGLLTGKYQENWGAYNLEDMMVTGVPLSENLLSSIFKKNGYSTAVVGKWHSGLKDKEALKNDLIDARHKRSSCHPAYSPLGRGFDYYYGYNSSESKYLNADDLWEGNKAIDVLPDGVFLTDHLNDKAKEFMVQSINKKEPFFLYYAPMSIHGGITQPPAIYKSKFNSGVEFTDRIAGHLNALDVGLQDLFKTLKNSGQDKNTLIIVCADNGPAHPVVPFSAPFKAGKGSGFLGGSHVPLIMILPGTTKPIQISQNVSLLDIMPTALEMAGLPVPLKIDGKSLKAIITGKDIAYAPHEYLFSSGSHAISWTINYLDGITPIETLADKDRKVCPNYLWGIRGSDVYLSLSPIKKGAYDFLPNGLPQQKFYYNLKDDILQNKNLYNEKNSRVRVLERKTIEWLKNMQEPAAYNREAYKSLSTNK